MSILIRLASTCFFRNTNPASPVLHSITARIKKPFPGDLSKPKPDYISKAEKGQMASKKDLLF
jgi:hypothetical protein